MSIDTQYLREAIQKAFDTNKPLRFSDEFVEELLDEIDRLRAIADTDKASADHWRAECERMRQGCEAVADDTEYYGLEPWEHQRHVPVATMVYPSHSPDKPFVALGDCAHLYRDAAKVQSLYTSTPLQADACKVPQGWKLVPAEPTPEMLKAATSNYKHPDRWVTERTNVYKRMLSAAPTQVEKAGNGLPTEWARVIHYPECWDTAAYPTLQSAVHEVLAWSGCGEHRSAPDVG